MSLREVRARKGAMGYVQAFRERKGPSLFAVLLEDSAALIGLCIALLGLLAAQWLQMPELDGLASIGIGAVLACSAFLLARQTKGLLIGEPAAQPLSDALRRIAAADPDVCAVTGVLSVQMGPEQVVAALSAEFEDQRSTAQIEACIARIERAARAEHPQLQSLFVKPQTPEAWQLRCSPLRAPPPA